MDSTMDSKYSKDFPYTNKRSTQEWLTLPWVPLLLCASAWLGSLRYAVNEDGLVE